MRTKEEPPFMINGVKSWINCMERIKGPNDRNCDYMYHYHDYVEMLYALDAECEIWINGKCHNFVTGDLAVINSNEPHYVFANKHSRYVCVLFSPKILYSDEKSFSEFKYVMPFLLGNSHKTVFHDGEIKDVKSLSVEILDEWERMDYAYELTIRGNILKLFSRVLKRLKEEKIAMPGEQLNNAVKKAISYATENYETATVKEAAEICNLSYYHFSHMFKKEVGKSFCEYLLDVRINEGAKMLLSTQKSITEIAMLTGFSSSSHFISKFKIYKGVTPSKFRGIKGGI